MNLIQIDDFFVENKTAKEPPFGDPFVMIGTINSGGKRSLDYESVQGGTAGWGGAIRKKHAEGRASGGYVTLCIT